MPRHPCQSALMCIANIGATATEFPPPPTRVPHIFSRMKYGQRRFCGKGTLHSIAPYCTYGFLRPACTLQNRSPAKSWHKAGTMLLRGKRLRSRFLRKARSELQACPPWTCKPRKTKPLRKEIKQTLPIQLDGVGYDSHSTEKQRGRPCCLLNALQSMMPRRPALFWR